MQEGGREAGARVRFRSLLALGINRYDPVDRQQACVGRAPAKTKQSLASSLLCHHRRPSPPVALCIHAAAAAAMAPRPSLL
eukprot:7065388-Pyramimonas_sp.AAC.1